jgi:hypothetical protein
MNEKKPVVILKGRSEMKKSVEIVNNIIDDLSGRVGLGGVWDRIVEETRKEIVANWIGIIDRILTEKKGYSMDKPTAEDKNDGNIILKPVLTSQEAANSIAEFFKTLPNMNVIPCDEPFEAFKGFLAFPQHPLFSNIPSKPASEVTLWFGWQYGKPVKREDRSPIQDSVLDPSCPGDLHKEVVLMIRNCITDSQWLLLDDPKRLMFGFVKYAPLLSNRGTECRLISLTGLKKLPEDLRKEVLAWRDDKRNIVMENDVSMLKNVAEQDINGSKLKGKQI